MFLDPLAEAFAAAGSLPADGKPPRAPVDDAARRRWGAVAFSIVVRTRFPDELLRDAADAGCRQVVLLGAGMASRAYRLDWPSGTRLFEIDTAERWAPRSRCSGSSRPIRAASGSPYRSTYATTGPVPLAAAGHDPALPTVCIAEGLLIHLPQDAVERLLGQVGSCPRPAAGWA
ncbi:SAM-dependent methyltransferase [Streptomyces mirabilis]|uniref:SAM-dependent methyltransferase n=1 Tax=Streptomyces mirabilis TaxID=68239 RepID=UPI003627CCBD